MNMYQAGLVTQDCFFSVENRNHVWRDLSRLVDVGVKKLLVTSCETLEVVSDLKLESVT